MNLRNVELNLLVAFDALMRERSVSRAAERTFITQPAMSHALNRLRLLFDDPLFVRTPRGMQPTPRAEELIDPIRRVLRDIEALMGPTRVFDAAGREHRFSLGSTDYMEFLLLPPLMGLIQSHAPKVDVHTRQLGIDELAEELEEGQIDVGLGFAVALQSASHLRRETLFEDRMACMVRRDHPLARDGLTLDSYLNLNHILISSSGDDQGIVDHWLEERGMKRRLELIITHFLSAPYIVAKTDMVLSLPLRIAASFESLAPVKTVAIPFDLPSYPVEMVWHPLREKDPAGIWLRDQIRAVSRMMATAD